MASTLKVNTIDTQSGPSITIPTGKTLAVTDASALTVGGTAITSGSSNILRKTADYTIVTGDVSGKSELVITTNAAASTRTITLPAVAAVGMSTCIITIVADADATSTYKLMVQDSASAEVWTGYQKNDFVRLIVSNSLWVVLDHKETYYSRRYLTADSPTVAVAAVTKMTGWTNVTEIGNTWDNANNKLITPTGMNGYWTISWNSGASVHSSPLGPSLWINGSAVSQYANYTGSSGYMDGQNGVTGKYYATSTQVIEFYLKNCRSDASAVAPAGGAVDRSHFIAQFERVY